jgi:PIN domain nuclease of toxin-antitoxin system
MSNYVLDASAILAFLNEEPGAERVADVINDAVVSAVNMSEVITKLIDVGMPEADITLVLSYLNLDVRAYDLDDAWNTAKLRPLTRQKGLSLGDRACLGLAGKLGITAITTDKSWKELQLDIKIELIR